MSSMRGTTTKLWPPRLFSRSQRRWPPYIVERVDASSGSAAAARAALREIEICCNPISCALARAEVGVALSVSRCVSPDRRRRCLSAAPNRCSSSMTTRPSFRYASSFAADRAGPDHHRDRSVGEPSAPAAFSPGRSTGAEQAGDDDVGIGEASPERLEMLAHQHGRRRGDRLPSGSAPTLAARSAISVLP